ncbi:hypothetical protein SLS55_003547 [Diplodia seriata]|uniref:HPP transmembrane region domain-containing protein n=1 Tax=Diplodia seriata TaxID=420778 RepID=A0ABR3CPG7_9PEZI
MKLPAAKDVHFDIDQYLNRFVPRNRINRLPKPLSRFLGYREKPAPPIGNIIQATWALVGAFCGLTVVTAVYKFGPGIAKYNPPVIVASLGAAAVLNYNVIATPLAQPRNAVVGNTLAALTGVCVAKLFMLLDDDFDAYRWLAGPLCCGCASIVITEDRIFVPEGFHFGVVDARFVELLRARLRGNDGSSRPPESEAGSNGTDLASSRDMLPSLKSQKSCEER